MAKIPNINVYEHEGTQYVPLWEVQARLRVFREFVDPPKIQQAPRKVVDAYEEKFQIPIKIFRVWWETAFKDLEDA